MSDDNWKPVDINVSKLLNEFRNAGLAISFIGWSNDGTLHYHWEIKPTDIMLKQASQIVFDHNPAIDTEESKRIMSEQMGYSIEKRIYNAETGLKDVSTKVGK